MGLFPEIERAWITVDHRLFLWDYEDGYAMQHKLRNSRFV